MEKINLHIQQKLLQAKSFGDTGKYLHALQIYKNLISNGIYAPEVFIEYSNFNLQNNRLEDAIKILEKGHILIPEDEDIMFQLGLLYLQNEEYSKTISLLKKVVNKKPPLLNYCLGVANFYKEDFNRAEKYFHKVLNQDPNFPKVNLFIGEALINRKLFADSIKYFKKELASDPRDWAAQYLLGTAYFELLDFEYAAKSFIEAVNIKPDEIYGLVKCVESLLELGRFVEAEKYLFRIIKINPDYFAGVVAAAKLYYKKGEYDISLKYIKKALKIDPSSNTVKEFYKKFKTLEPQ